MRTVVTATVTLQYDKPSGMLGASATESARQAIDEINDLLLSHGLEYSIGATIQLAGEKPTSRKHED